MRSPRANAEDEFQPSLDNEKKFRDTLRRTRKWVVVDQDMDGNCLFRSVSHQVYGTERHHAVVREKCMDYIEHQGYFFESFVDEPFDMYVARLRLVGEWGGDLEIQAMAEIYNRPIEIYAYQLTPKRIYAQHLSNEAIRLSYHFRSHYNSVMDPAHFRSNFVRSAPGEAEDAYIRRARRLGRRNDPNDVRQISDREATETDTLRSVLEQSRQEFQSSDSRDFDDVVKQSLIEFDKHMQHSIQDAVAESEREQYDRELLEVVLATSQKKRALMQPGLSQEDQVLHKVLSQSMRDCVHKQPEGVAYDESLVLPAPIRLCVAQGFPLESVVEAYSVCFTEAGPDTLIAALMTDYILS